MLEDNKTIELTEDELNQVTGGSQPIPEGGFTFTRVYNTSKGCCYATESKNLKDILYVESIREGFVCYYKYSIVLSLDGSSWISVRDGKLRQYPRDNFTSTYCYKVNINLA